MTKEQIGTFKSEMIYYRWLQDTIKRYKEKVDLIEYDMENVKGISFEEKVSGAKKDEERRLELIDEYNRILDKLNQYQKRYDYLNSVLDKMTMYEKNMFLMIFEEGKTYQEVANKFYISKAGLFYRMQKVLERIEI